MEIEVTCAACRLVQPASAVCAACGAPEPSPLPTLRVAPLAERRVRPLVVAAWFAVTVVLAPIVIVVVGILLAVLAGFSFHAVLLAPLSWVLYRAWRKPRLQPIPRGRLDGAWSVRGIVRAPGAVACDALQLADDRGRVFVWSARPASFEVVTPDGEAIVVRGVVRVQAPPRPADAAARGLLLGGVDPRLRVDGEAERVTLRDGDEVELRAAVHEEPIAAGYRELARGRVAHGEPGRPVTVAVVRRAADSRPRL